MPWLRVDDRMYCNAKTCGVSHEGFRLWMWASDYSSDQLTDGRLKEWQVIMLAGMIRLLDWRVVAEELVAAHLFDRDGDDYLVHDYLKYNPSREKVLEERAATADRVREYRERRQDTNTGQIDGDDSNALCNGVTHRLRTTHPVPVPVPIPILDNDLTTADAVVSANKVARRPTRQKTEVPAGFEEFWEAYPRKIARSVALRAYSKALLDGCTSEAMFTGAGNYSQECIMTARERQFICFPATFLNQRRFEDYQEPPSPADFRPRFAPNGRAELQKQGPEYETFRAPKRANTTE